MAHEVFNACTVAHHICGKLRQILIIENTHREFAYQFRNSDTGILGCGVTGNISLAVIIFTAQEIDDR